MNTQIIIAAFYDGNNWITLDLDLIIASEKSPFKSVDIVDTVKALSKRDFKLYGVYYNPNHIGEMLLDNPHMLFLHGIRYNREDTEFTPIETIIDNAKMGI